jgi:hypothetical protein
MKYFMLAALYVSFYSYSELILNDCQSGIFESLLKKQSLAGGAGIELKGLELVPGPCQK